MNTGQIVSLIIIFLLGFLGYYKSNFEKNEIRRGIWSGLSFMMFGFVTMLVIVQTQEVNKLQKQVKEKCPQYEKVDSVYKLKN